MSWFDDNELSSGADVIDWNSLKKKKLQVQLFLVQVFPHNVWNKFFPKNKRIRKIMLELRSETLEKEHGLMKNDIFAFIYIDDWLIEYL